MCVYDMCEYMYPYIPDSSFCLYMDSEDYFILFMINNRNYIDSPCFAMHAHSPRYVNRLLNVWEYAKLQSLLLLMSVTSDKMWMSVTTNALQPGQGTIVFG